MKKFSKLDDRLAGTITVLEAMLIVAAVFVVVLISASITAQHAQNTASRAVVLIEEMANGSLDLAEIDKGQNELIRQLQDRLWEAERTIEQLRQDLYGPGDADGGKNGDVQAQPTVLYRK